MVRDEAGRLVGSVALVLAGDFGEVTESDDEAAFRMLVVDPAARGRGIGGAPDDRLPGPGPGGRQAADGALDRAR